MKRRSFLNHLAAVGGTGAVYAAMRRMGLIASAAAATPQANPQVGAGKTALVLGAGIAGLIATYELERRGFAVTLLEADNRLGGKTWTLRGGDTIEMLGETAQRVGFSPGLYMDAGPSRIPGDHQRLLGYCRALDVPLEVEVNMNRAAYLWSPRAHGGKPLRLRQAANDARGYLSELLTKATDRGALDQELTAEDKERLLPFLRIYGDLDPAGEFRGTDRAGVMPRETSAELFRQVPPQRLQDLLKDPMLRAIVYDDQIDQQATMLQPVGGMDRIVAAFEKAIRAPIHRNMEVKRIAAKGARVDVIGREIAKGGLQTFSADVAIVTIPPHLLAQIDSTLPKDVKAALASFAPDYANKIGFEAPRFWEADGIYGGLSFLDDETQMAMYPSGGLNQPRGVLIGAYNRGVVGEAFAAKTIADQIAATRRALAHIHPGHDADLVNAAVVNWNKVPFNLGPWAYLGGMREGHIEKPALRMLNAMAGPIQLAGAYLTQLPGWQEGAVMSAQDVVARLSR